MVNKNTNETDLFFMREALIEAEKAKKKDEVPVGAILVYKNKIVARAHNLVESSLDATAHAEILCIRAATKILNNWRLIDTILYCTLEPCAMCLGAMINSRITRLVYGAKDLRQGAHGSWTLLENHPIHQINIEGGLLATESAGLMKNFFKEKRDGKLIRRIDRGPKKKIAHLCEAHRPQPHP